MYESITISQQTQDGVTHWEWTVLFDPDGFGYEHIQEGFGSSLEDAAAKASSMLQALKDVAEYETDNND